MPIFGVTVEQVVALIAERAAATLVVPGTLSLDDLLANYPASADMTGKYARVSNLFGNTDEVLRCRYDGVAYRWVPQRQEGNMTLNAPSGTTIVRPLYSPPTVRVTGTITGTASIQPATANAWIGQRLRVIMAGALGLGAGLSITDVTGGAVPLIAGGVKDIEYGPTGWFLAA